MITILVRPVRGNKVHALTLNMFNNYNILLYSITYKFNYYLRIKEQCYYLKILQQTPKQNYNKNSTYLICILY